MLKVTSNAGMLELVSLSEKGTLCVYMQYWPGTQLSLGLSGNVKIALCPLGGCVCVCFLSKLLSFATIQVHTHTPQLLEPQRGEDPATNTIMYMHIHTCTAHFYGNRKTWLLW